MPVNKRFFVDQLRQRFVDSLATTRRAESDAREAAQNMATEAEKKEDGRVMLEFGSMANAQALRAQKVKAELAELDALAQKGLRDFTRQMPIALGAIIDLACDDDDDGSQERTFMLLPVGAGTELTGPGGDGFLSVITPASPIGGALMGKKAGDIVDIRIKGDVREWTIVDVV